MVPTNLDVLAWQERSTGLLCEAEKARLVMQARAGQKSRDHSHHRALSWLRRQLTARRWRSQEGHRTPTVVLRPQAVDRC
jgi:hypothetical protein